MGNLFYDCRCLEEIEVDERPVKKADFLQAVQCNEHGHHAGERSGGANAGHQPAGVEKPVESCRADARDQVESEIAALAERFLDEVADDEQDGHVAQQMVETAMQEYVPDQPAQRRRRRAKAEAFDNG